MIGWLTWTSWSRWGCSVATKESVQLRITGNSPRHSGSTSQTFGNHWRNDTEGHALTALTQWTVRWRIPKSCWSIPVYACVFQNTFVSSRLGKNKAKSLPWQVTVPNDAPVKTADIGIGMGITGIEAFSASDMILQMIILRLLSSQWKKDVRSSNIQKTIQYLHC